MEIYFKKPSDLDLDEAIMETHWKEFKSWLWETHRIPINAVCGDELDGYIEEFLED
jgi:hypothetical protein